MHGGILISDISDHLPVFVVFSSLVNNTDHIEMTNFTRKITDKTLENLKIDLLQQNWSDVYVDNIDQSYEVFIFKISKLYDKHCPLVLKAGNRQSVDKPWITKGLQNACKKNFFLYKQFIKLRTIEAESKYKTYKNKLTNIMRSCKRQYYSSSLEKNKTNIKGTWRLLHEIINKKKVTKDYPTSFYTNTDTVVKDNKAIADHFNDYFVNVGKNLANSITSPKICSLNYSNKITRIKDSMFIRETNEQEILDIVNKLKGKKSTDRDSFNMFLIKNIIDCVAKPFTYICNLSLMSGKFPSGMKVA